VRPKILVTPDLEAGEWPRLWLKRCYADAVVRAGGLPLVTPYAAEVAELLELCDGVLITGGAFDVPPGEYGETRLPACGPENPERTAFERRLLEGALARGIPVLGVCGGMQLLNVVCGGSLYQDLKTQVPAAGDHEQKTPRDRPAHPLAVEAGSWLARTVGLEGLAVNSTHHQAVNRVGDGLVAVGFGPDGIVEAIEDPRARFVVGVQWHPEMLLDSAPWNLAVYRGLVEAAGERR
jgi:putative glutamine amidotransferase